MKALTRDVYLQMKVSVGVWGGFFLWGGGEAGASDKDVWYVNVYGWVTLW